MGRRKSRELEHLKPNPDPDNPDVLIVDKKRVALGQLETAIQLWFREGDPVSIHALAAAAHDCLDAMSSKIGKPSEFKTWLNSLPEDLQARARYFTNFIKHGRKHLEEECPYSPSHGEGLIWFAGRCYRAKFGSPTPLLLIFDARFAFENPGWIRAPEFIPLWSNLLEIDEPGAISRKDFLEKSLPVVSRMLGHIESITI